MSEPSERHRQEAARLVLQPERIAAALAAAEERGLERAAEWCEEAARLQRADAQATGELSAQRRRFAAADELAWAAERIRELARGGA